jgi:hypothetical protein
MDLAGLANAMLLLIVAGVGAVLFSRRLDRIESRFDRLPTREEIDARFDALETRTARLEVESTGLRADLTQIALAVGARPRPQTG